MSAGTLDKTEGFKMIHFYQKPQYTSHCLLLLNEAGLSHVTVYFTAISSLHQGASGETDEHRTPVSVAFLDWDCTFL